MLVSREVCFAETKKYEGENGDVDDHCLHMRFSGEGIGDNLLDVVKQRIGLTRRVLPVIY